MKNEQLCLCCGEEAKEFKEIVKKEVKFNITPNKLFHENIGWFCGLDDLKINNWPISKDDGVYLLWEKIDYCPQHKLFISEALYVGKGNIKKRIYDHAKNKGFTEENLVYFSFLDIPNRSAKYIEQLLLDLYKFPLNKAENNGQAVLYSYLTQTEVDFGTL